MYNLQRSQKFGTLIGYTYDIFVLINQISSSHKARQKEFYENRMTVAQTIGISDFRFLHSF